MNDDHVKSVGMPIRHASGYVKKVIEHMCLEFRSKAGFDDMFCNEEVN